MQLNYLCSYKYFFIPSGIELTNLTVDIISGSELNAIVSWELVNAGLPPITQFLVFWKVVPLEQTDLFSNGSFLEVFDDSRVVPTNGTADHNVTFSITFAVENSTRYVTIVNATNDEETRWRAFFIMFDSSGEGIHAREV